MVRTVRPNASATPTNPIPRFPIPAFGNAAARTALPHPPNTSQNVPTNSAVAFLPSDISHLLKIIQQIFGLRNCNEAIIAMGPEYLKEESGKLVKGL
jgi:hypothetical protein